MLRDQLSDALKVALKTQDKASLGTIRLILASIKDQDISVRADGNSEGVSDAQILSLLQTMVKQRNESIRFYEDGGRHDLADQEKNEINQMIEKRDEYRMEKNYDEADKIRDEIAEKNIIFIDHKNKTIWVKQEKIKAE